jgi:hypothetical protein
MAVQLHGGENAKCRNGGLSKTEIADYDRPVRDARPRLFAQQPARAGGGGLGVGKGRPGGSPARVSTREIFENLSFRSRFAASGQPSRQLLQLRVFCLRLLQDGDVGVCVFPEGEKIFVGGAGFGCVALQYVGACKAEASKRAQRAIYHDASVI